MLLPEGFGELQQRGGGKETKLRKKRKGIGDGVQGWVFGCDTAYEVVGWTGTSDSSVAALAILTILWRSLATTHDEP